MDILKGLLGFCLFLPVACAPPPASTTTQQAGGTNVGGSLVNRVEDSTIGSLCQGVCQRIIYATPMPADSPSDSATGSPPSGAASSSSPAPRSSSLLPVVSPSASPTPSPMSGPLPATSLSSGSSSSSGPSASPMPSPTSTVSPSPTMSPTMSPSPSPTPSPTPTPSSAIPGLSPALEVARFTNNAGQTHRLALAGNRVLVLTVNQAGDLLLYQKGVADGAFTSQSLGTGVFNRSELAISPGMAFPLLTLWKQGDRLLFRSSSDQGQSWAAADQLCPGFGEWQSEPVDAYANGRHYIAFQALVNAQIDLYLTVSDELGRFSEPRQMTFDSQQEDLAGLAVYQNHVYLTYVRFDTADMYLLHSSDNGQSFGVPVRVNQSPGSLYRAGQPVVDANGRLLIAYSDRSQDSEGDLLLASSQNEGQSFSYSQIAGSNWRSQDGAVLRLDASNRMHVVWTDFRNNQYSVYYARSTDGGQNFSEVRLDPEQNLRSPSLAIAADGTAFLTVTLDQGGGDGVFPILYYRYQSPD